MSTTNTTSPSPATVAAATSSDSTPPYDRAEAIKQFDDSKLGVKGLVDSGIKTIPAFFIHPPETRPDLKTLPVSESNIPTVDLSVVNSSRGVVVDQVRRAASTFGFFQVTNHGVPPELLRRTLSAIKAFHEQPAEARAQTYRRDMETGVAYRSNMDLFQSKAASWRDTLQIKLGPTAAERSQIPEVCRDEVMEWDREVVRLGEVLLGLLSEGLGLGAARFTEMVGDRLMVGHYYPFCPQADLTVGLTSHTDPGALTVLLQDHVGGLQVRTKDGWVDVKPVPGAGALVINIGDLLQIISNEEYKSADHRVLANSSDESRVSVAVFLNPSNREKMLGPLPELISAEKPALYRNFTLNEFMTRFLKKELDSKSLTNYFR